MFQRMFLLESEFCGPSSTLKPKNSSSKIYGTAAAKAKPNLVIVVTYA